MPPLRPEEEWVRRLLEVELGVPVNQHDDGSRPALHDLDVIDGELERAAVEATAAVDAESRELWNVVNGDDRWVDSDLVGGWSVHVKPNARGLSARTRWPSRIREGIREGRAFRARVGDLGFEVAARRLGVVHATQSDTDFPGSIYVTL